MDFIKIMHNAACEKRQQGKMKTAASYQTATDAFSYFLAKQQHLSAIDIKYIDCILISQFEQYLLYSRGVSRNTSSAYMRPLKATYNHWVKKGICINKNPFDSVFTGIDKTHKRAVSPTIIQELIQLDLPINKGLKLSRDIFLFSFFTRGMAFIDIAHLTHSHIVNNRIIYNRHKTNKLLSIKIEPIIGNLIRQYTDSSRKHIFPLFKDDIFSWQHYDSALRLHNRNLHQLSKLLKLESPLTSYVARHSWATHALHKQIPTRIISEALGHSREETTTIYLASLNPEQIDDANHIILQEYKVAFDLIENKQNVSNHSSTMSKGNISKYK